MESFTRILTTGRVMHRMSKLALLLLALFAVACSGSDSGEGAEGLGELVASSGALELTIELESAGDALGVGQNALLITVTDLGGVPITDANVTVDPQMPSMGHGSSEEPVVTHSGDGVYRAFPVTFTMAGDWEVTFVAETPDGRSGRETWRYDVPQSDASMDMGDGSGMDMGEGSGMGDGSGMDMGEGSGA